MARQERTAYQQKLLDPRWQKKRLEVLQRDEWACVECENEEATLHVHHLYYENNTDPWDYPAEALVTLCKDCHEDESRYRYREEQILLSTLRKARLMHYDILDIAFGFHRWMKFKDKLDKDFVMTALRWALDRPAVINHIADLYMEYLEEKSRRRTDGPGKPQ